MMSAGEYLDALLSLPGMRGASVSRDGKWVAWTWFRTGPAADVYRGTDRWFPRADTPHHTTDDDTFLVSWTPDSRAVIVEQDRDGNERAQLYRVDLERPLEMVPLTEVEPNYFIRGGELHPNGRWLVYGANSTRRPGQEIEPTWIYRHDLETGERLALARPEKGGYDPAAAQPQGRPDPLPAHGPAPGRAAGLAGGHRGRRGPGDPQLWGGGQRLTPRGSPTGSGCWCWPRPRPTAAWGFGSWMTARCAGCWTILARNIERAFVPHGSVRIVVVEGSMREARCSLLDPETGEEIGLPAVPGNLIPLAPLAPPTGDVWLGTISVPASRPIWCASAIGDRGPEVFQASPGCGSEKLYA